MVGKEAVSTMNIKSLHVRQYRSILDETLQCSQLTALLGPNGCGKSSFLRALDLFYSPHPRFSIDDFYACDASSDIEIEVIFTALTEEEKDCFRDYVREEDLRVVRVFSLCEGKTSDKCYGYRPQNPDFLSLRAAGGATQQRGFYEQLRQQVIYAQFPRWTNRGDVLAYLEHWESDHSGCCISEKDSGDFFGFDQGKPGDLTQYTRFIFIPAVRDAATDATEGKGSAITELTNLFLRNALSNRDEFKRLKAEFQQRYDELFNRESLPEVQELEVQLTQTLQEFAPGASVSLSLGTGSVVDVPLPKVEVQLTEDGYPSDITRKGHGIQRAFIVTLLQHQAVAQPQISAAGDTSETSGSYAPSEDQRFPALVLAIEEPELYQHPARQRHFANVLSRLAGGTVNGVARQTQVLYCTHSPLFVSIDWFDNLRLLRKARVKEASQPMVTRVTYTTLDQVANILWNATGSMLPSYSGSTLRPRLRSLMTPWMNEGFFADVVVLVEGEDDRAAIQGVAALLNYDLESQGIVIIPCDGKSNLGKAAVIFRSLEIPTYVIWDSDNHSYTKQSDIDRTTGENRCLLRLMGRPQADWPNEIMDTFACFDTNLEKTLMQEIGEIVFNQLLEECQRDFDISKPKQAVKNPLVIAALLQKAKAEGKGSITLEQIFHRVKALRSGSEASKRVHQLVSADVQIDDSTENDLIHAQLVGIRGD